MSNKMSDWTRLSSVRGGGAGNISSRSPRLEILDLQKRLAQAEGIALCHAVMLREGDHRIKNSLQIIASLLNGQARQETSDTVRGALMSAAARIRSVSVIHDALQAVGDLDVVDLGEVLTRICGSLQEMAGTEGFIDVTLHVESVRMPVTVAQPLALAANELVINAFRHAFRGRDAGVICVRLLEREGQVSLEVSDDGVGLPEGYDAGGGFGTRLVRMMVRQVDGSLTVDRAAGTSFTIQLPARESLTDGVPRQG